MLDRSKIMIALQQASSQLFVGFAQELDIAYKTWRIIATDDDFACRIRKEKQSLLVPWWNELLGDVVDISKQSDNYAILSVDGSQIYYDKHQGPPCFLINVGFMQLRYGCAGKAVLYGNKPFLISKFDGTNDYGSQEFINLQREAYEFDCILDQIIQMQAELQDQKLLCLFDGSLIFFHIQDTQSDLKNRFLDYYCSILEQLYQRRVLIAGYMSLPKSKELVNLCKLQLAQFDSKSLEHTSVIDRLTDVDVINLYVKPHQRSIVFQSKAPIGYAYPPHLKPYFCYLHVGFEIVRLEFPAWIGRSDELVDKICSIALDQAVKGRGYPVCLFEAHEQAVVKAADRDFFYQLLEKMSRQQLKSYVMSQKSIKKQQPMI